MTIRISQSQVHASDQGSDDVVRNSPGVRRKLAEGIGSLLGWRKGVRQKKIESRRKIVKDSRNAYRDLGIGPRIGRCGGSSLGVR
ncbi:hypothetical protein B296_00047281 [Ensete ventricosum]|uniref:Uncharacterized protein n=1 Tax=Ensete ventricosum TaxID=4639 RepID=A0A426XE30_ENSVE|nr:hypothetical protein B296_00047281 [Ensete ventricosum]